MPGDLGGDRLGLGDNPQVVAARWALVEHSVVRVSCSDILPPCIRHYWGYIYKPVEIAFDPLKSARNEALRGLRGLPFDRAAEFDFTTAIIRRDTRNRRGAR